MTAWEDIDAKGCSPNPLNNQTITLVIGRLAWWAASAAVRYRVSRIPRAAHFMRVCPVAAAAAQDSLGRTGSRYRAKIEALFRAKR